jgi:transposase
MYLKVTRNSAGQAYYHLVESYWENGRSRQRVLMSLGRVGEDRIEETIEALAQHTDLFTIAELARSISIEDTYILGPLLVLEKIFDRFGINAILDRVAQKHPRLGLDLKKIVFTLVAARFVKPGSKLKIYEHWLKKLYPEMVDPEIGLHQIYRALDILYTSKEDIEQSLYWHDKDLLSMEVDVVLYDLTTLRFESTRQDLGDLRRFGYSKEMRTDCTQIVFGLLLGTDGVPLGFEVYPGNTFEGDTLKDIVSKMRQKFKVRRFIFVADRGLFSAKNLDYLRGDDPKDIGEYIVGMKLGVFKKRHDEFYDLSRFHWIGDELAIYETTHEGERCIITWSKVRAGRDQKTRADILAKIQKKLSSKKVTAKTFVSNRNYQRFLTGLSDGETPKINDMAIAQDAKRDGFFGVLTNVKYFTAKEVVVNYKQLWAIEDAFGEIKGNLKARPVFHWQDRRIVGHLTMCFLAYFCEAQLTKAIREKNLILKSPAIDDDIIDPRQLTVVEAMRELSEVRAIPVKVRSNTIWVRTDINGNAAKLFHAIEAPIPPKLLNVKTKNLLAQTLTPAVKLPELQN